MVVLLYSKIEIILLFKCDLYMFLCGSACALVDRFFRVQQTYDQTHRCLFIAQWTYIYTLLFNHLAKLLAHQKSPFHLSFAEVSMWFHIHFTHIYVNTYYNISIWIDYNIIVLCRNLSQRIRRIWQNEKLDRFIWWYQCNDICYH